jgi:hypothetical protein
LHPKIRATTFPELSRVVVAEHGSVLGNGILRGSCGLLGSQWEAGERREG